MAIRIDSPRRPLYLNQNPYTIVAFKFKKNYRRKCQIGLSLRTLLSRKIYRETIVENWVCLWAFPTQYAGQRLEGYRKNCCYLTSGGVFEDSLERVKLGHRKKLRSITPEAIMDWMEM